MILDILLAIEPQARVFTLDTGVLFPETYETWRRIEERYDITIDVYRGEWIDGLWQRDPDACCGMRKVEPLERALSDVDAWITGLRRDQSPSRAGTPKLAEDSSHPGKLKCAPLADWTEQDVWRYIVDNDVPVPPAARPRVRLDRLRALHAAGRWPRRPLGRHRQDRVRPAPADLLMDPAIILFGLGVGVLVGTTGMGGGSLMTPLLILVFGIKPVVAVGHRPRLRRRHQDGRRLAALPQGHGVPADGVLAGGRLVPGRARRRVAARPPARRLGRRLRHVHARLDRRGAAADRRASCCCGRWRSPTTPRASATRSGCRRGTRSPPSRSAGRSASCSGSPRPAPAR